MDQEAVKRELMEKYLPEQADQKLKALRSLFTSGGSFVLDAPAAPPAVWGKDGDVLWAEGEALMIAAPQGAGKTTVAFQLVRARLGLQPDVLGLPVTPGSGCVLYLAMDRPAQASRASHRLFTEEDRSVLEEKLIVWKGPPPSDLAKSPGILTTMCKLVGADTVIVDSLKDAAIGLSDDAVGAGYNRARQRAIASGVQVLELHHTRKAGTNGAEPNTISDVYGSTWLTSGVGSVISLFGDPGDPVVSFRHLKQPMNEVGPWKLLHDHATGRTTVQHAPDLVELARMSRPEGLTKVSAAEMLYGTTKPTPAEKEKAGRKLGELATKGILVEIPGAKGGPGGSRPTTWHVAA